MPEERLYLDGSEDIFYNSFENEHYLNYEGRIYTVVFDDKIKKNYICLSTGESKVL